MGRRTPSTAALRALEASGVSFEIHTYAYVERGGAAASSLALGVPLHEVIKTLVFEDEDGAPMIVLMHGDREVSAKALARQIGCKKCRPCDPATAEKHSGYKVGGTSPFGLRKPMPVYVEESVFDLERIWVNGGARGLLVSLPPNGLPTPANVRRVRVARR